MAKKKKGISERVHNKKKQTEKKVNPFEVKINRQKHDVFGRKASKFDRGAPGVARSKAIKKRKEKLLKELEEKDKSNRFIDKRLGETDPNLSLEEKMTQRFALEKKRSHEKGGLFNLDEDIELTHYGQSLLEMEKFEGPPLSDDEEMETDKGNLDADFVREELFGGFLTKSSDKDKDGRSWKERLQEVIAKSKQAKHERQSERDQAIEMTEKLDQQWKELQAHVTSNKKQTKNVTEMESSQQTDDYDIKVRELKFEMTGKATDRLKTVEEMAQDEAQRLIQLEEDRVRRMKGVLTTDKPTTTHVSADDLNDCYAIDDGPRATLTYKDGRVCGDSSAKEDSEDGQTDMVEDHRELLEPADQEWQTTPDGSEDEEADEASEEGEDNSDSDSYTDIHLDDDKSPAETEECGEAKNTKRDLMVRKRVMEEARNELAYTFEVPTSLEELETLLQDYSVEDQFTIIHRIRQCNHSSLAEGNKQKLEVLFTILLEYVSVASDVAPPQLALIDRLIIPLYELCQQSPIKCGLSFIQIIRSLQKSFQQLVQHKRPKGYPTLDVLIYLKLVSVLFPTSDFHHPVVTPAFLFLGQLLSQCPVNQARDAAAGLFLSTLALEYVSSSRRYIPEAIIFLHGLLFLASIKDETKVESVIPPFRPVGKNINLLLTKRKHLIDISYSNRLSLGKTLSSHVDKGSLESDAFKLTVISGCLDLVLEFSHLYEGLPCHREIFQPISYMVNKLPRPVANLFQEKLQSIREHIDTVAKKERIHLTMKSRKPQPMKMFEPKIETIFDGKKKRSGGTKEYNEKQRLIHKHKREFKGAVREIRRDTQFIARAQLQKQLKKDAVRAKRVKDIHQMLAEQEGDFNALKRKKARAS